MLSLGSNLGDRLASLQAAVEVLDVHDGIGSLAVSSVYETQPVGGPRQGPYLNAVVSIDTTLSAPDLLEIAHQIENSRGRVRVERWGPRTVDVDVIVVGDEVRSDPVLTLPHPRAHARAFVLLPWLEIDPDADIPGEGRVRDLLAGADTSGVRRMRDAVLRP